MDRTAMKAAKSMSPFFMLSARRGGNDGGDYMMDLATYC